jgi:hypothetical protein
MKFVMAASLEFIVIRNQNAPKAKRERGPEPADESVRAVGSLAQKKDGTNGELFVPGGQ